MDLIDSEQYEQPDTNPITLEVPTASNAPAARRRWRLHWRLCGDAALPELQRKDCHQDFDTRQEAETQAKFLKLSNAAGVFTQISPAPLSKYQRKKAEERLKPFKGGGPECLAFPPGDPVRRLKP
jgi:hypothetical protein